MFVFLGPVLSDAQPQRFETPILGLRVMQGGIAQPIADVGAHLQVTLSPAPFHLALPELEGDGALLALGTTAALFDRSGSADPLFAPGAAYARDPKAGILYLTDPACRGGVGTGFNILWADQARAGAWPVERIEPDRASDRCAAPSLPPRETLIAPGAVIYLVISDGDDTEFMVLVFEEAPSS